MQSDPAASRLRRLSAIVALSLVAVATIWTAAVVAVLHLHRIATVQAETNLLNLGRAIAGETEALLSGAENSAGEIRAWVESGSGTPELVQAVLDRQLPESKFLRSFSVFAADGRLDYFSGSAAAPVGLSVGDRQWFIAIKSGASRRLVVGDPIKSQLDGKWIIPLGVRVDSRDNRFAGAVGAALDAAIFSRLFEAFDLGEGAAVTLQRRDGTVLARAPAAEEFIGKVVAGPVVQRASEVPEVILHARSLFDGSNRIIVAERLGNLPLHVAISIPEAVAMQGWRLQATAVAIAAGALSWLIVVFAAAHARLRRQVQARLRAEAELAGKIQALHAANSRLERILETAGEGIYGIDADNMVTFANRGAADLLEWASPDAMVGQPGPTALGHLLADGSPCIQGDCSIRRTLSDGAQRLVGNEFFVTTTGRRLPVEYVVSAQTVDGHVSGCVVVFRDVSERRLAEQAQKERQELFEQVFVSGSAIKLLVDPADGAIVDANPAAAEFYGYSLDRLRAMTIHDVNALTRDEVCRRVDEAAASRSNYFIAVHRTAGGELRDVEVYTGPIRGQDRNLLMSIIHDISERARGERELKAAHQRLEEQAQELERSNADLEQFAYVASHDLREPLRMVSNFLSLVERRTGDKLDTETREFIEFAVDGAKRMDRLILDLLQYSRIGRLSQPMRKVAVAEAVELALANLRLTVEETGAEIAVAPELPELTASEDDLIRLFQNLIGNALKYRSPGHAPRIELVCRREGDGWLFRVQDNGIGISPANLDRVFGIFKRLHAMGEYEGTGIGLAICRKIVERHGGRIWAESAGEGAGAAFCFTLPGGDQA